MKGSRNDQKFIFVTKNGHAPTEETLDNYRHEFSKNKDVCGDSKNSKLLFAAGPNWNSPRELIAELARDNDAFIVILMEEQGYCLINKDEAFTDSMICYAEKFPNKNSWQIAMEYLKSAE